MFIPLNLHLNYFHEQYEIEFKRIRACQKMREKTAQPCIPGLREENGLKNNTHAPLKHLAHEQRIQFFFSAEREDA